MAESHELGQKGEDKALDFLINKGFKILFRNWRWGGHEVEIGRASCRERVYI